MGVGGVVFLCIFIHIYVHMHMRAMQWEIMCPIVGPTIYYLAVPECRRYYVSLVK